MMVTSDGLVTDGVIVVQLLYQKDQLNEEIR